MGERKLQVVEQIVAPADNRVSDGKALDDDDAMDPNKVLLQHESAGENTTDEPLDEPPVENPMEEAPVEDPLETPAKEVAVEELAMTETQSSEIPARELDKPITDKELLVIKQRLWDVKQELVSFSQEGSVEN